MNDTDIGEWHSRLTERINDQSVSQLTRRVVAIPRARVDRCRGEKPSGRVRPESLGREPGAV